MNGAERGAGGRQAGRERRKLHKRERAHHKEVTINNNITSINCGRIGSSSFVTCTQYFFFVAYLGFLIIICCC